MPPASEEITVTATRFERPLDLTPKTVSVVTPADIATRPMVNVQTAIDEVPNVAVARGGGLAGQIVVRGLASNDSRTVMFIDGDRFGRGRPAIEYNFLDPNELERIEIVRGPASALYGSDAMNGVVNFITRRGTGDSFLPRLASLGYGSASSLLAARVAVSGQREAYDALLGLNYRTADDYDTPQGEIANTDFETRSLNARLGYAPDATRRFEVSVRAGEYEAGRAGAPSAPGVSVREEPLEEQSLRLGYTQNQAASWVSDLQGSLFAREVNTFIRSVNSGFANGNVETRDTWVIGPTGIGGKVLARSPLAGNLLAYGVDYYYEDVPSFEDEVRVVDAAGNLVSISPRAKRIRAAEQSHLGAVRRLRLGQLAALHRLARHPLRHGAHRDRGQAGARRGPGAVRLLRAEPDLERQQGHRQRRRHLPGARRPPPGGQREHRLPRADDLRQVGLGHDRRRPHRPQRRRRGRDERHLRRRRALPAASRFDANLTFFRSEYSDLLQLVFINPTTRQRRNVGEAKTEGFELDGVATLTKSLALRFNAGQTRGTNTADRRAAALRAAAQRPPRPALHLAARQLVARSPRCAIRTTRRASTPPRNAAATATRCGASTAAPSSAASTSRSPPTG